MAGQWRMDSASDFGSGGCGFESRLPLFCFIGVALFQRWLVFARARVTVSSSSIISTFLPVEKDTNVQVHSQLQYNAQIQKMRVSWAEPTQL